MSKRLRALDQQLQGIRASDFFPGRDALDADAALDALRREVDLHLSPDEPAATEAAIAPLRVLAALVHYVDVGGLPVDEAPGFELLVRGLQARHARDDALLAAALPLFDAACAAMQVPDDP